MLKKLFSFFLIPCAFSFILPFTPTLINVKCYGQNNNNDFLPKIYDDNSVKNDYLILLENITMSHKNGTDNRFKQNTNITAIVLRRRQRVQRNKPTYIENLIFPVFDEDPVEEPELIPDDLVRRPRRRQLTPIIKSSADGTFQLEELDPTFNFTKIGGYKEVKAELTQVIDFLVNPDNYTKHGVRIPKGLLLEGPPGNGKTLIAKALAGEANTSFISTAGSIFNEKYVGVGAGRVRELFNLAKENLPCIIFIDELDAVAKKRTGSGEGADSERDQTLNQLLVAMDGFENKKPLLVVGATNRADILDKAILRPGRFDKIITVPNPDKETREEIINIHSTGKPLNVNITDLVKLTTGFSGAQIENIINEAVLYGIRNNSLPVTLNIFDMIRDRILLGQTTKKKQLSQNALKRVAIHEAGHLLLALTSKHVEKPEKVTIESSGSSALGFMLSQSSDVDEGLYLKEYLEDKLKILLGGRISEELLLFSISSGALNDLESANNIAKTLVLNYGMGNKIIYPHFSEEYKKKIDDDIHTFINNAYKEAKKILEMNRPLLIKLSNELYDRKTLTYSEICNIVLEYGASEMKTNTTQVV
jgi:cell division protease FtsH